MGIYFLWALLCAAIGTIPLLIARRFTGAVIQAAISFFILWWIFYASVASTVWPLFGLPGLLVFFLWVIGGVVNSAYEGDNQFFCFLPAIVYIVILAICGLIGNEFFMTETYRNMIGPVEVREWTQDIQPKDPKHMRMSTLDNAVYLTKKVIGQDGTIGSQFQVNPSELWLQMVKGELWYVAALEFKSYGAWNSKNVSPGYVMISAENPDVQPIIVNLPENQKMRYMPSAFFGKNLERHLRDNGYLGKGMANFALEIDDDGNPWWVVSIFEPQAMWWAAKVTGAAIVNPATGEIVFYPIGSVPHWVDRVVPGNYVSCYIDWWGEYVHGWWNTFPTFGSHLDMVESGDCNLIYGEGGEPEWVIDVTSASSADNSLVGLIYTNSRTGKSIYYKVSGGATNSAVLEAVDHNPQISFRKLFGADPQLYNVYGTMASVVPLFNESHAFQGVAIVPINNVQHVATGDNQYKALREYEKLISDHGERVTLAAERVLKSAEYVVNRINSEVTSTGNLYYIYVLGMSHLFTSSSGDSPKLPMTLPGDQIKVEYYDSDRDVVPLKSFDNLSLKLIEDSSQREVRERALSQREDKEAREDSVTLENRLKGLSVSQMRELLKNQPNKR